MFYMKVGSTESPFARRTLSPFLPIYLGYFDSLSRILPLGLAPILSGIPSSIPRPIRKNRPGPLLHTLSSRGEGLGRFSIQQKVYEKPASKSRISSGTCPVEIPPERSPSYRFRVLATHRQEGIRSPPYHLESTRIFLVDDGCSEAAWKSHHSRPKDRKRGRGSGRAEMTPEGPACMRGRLRRTFILESEGGPPGHWKLIHEKSGKADA